MRTPQRDCSMNRTSSVETKHSESSVVRGALKDLQCTVVESIAVVAKATLETGVHVEEIDAEAIAGGHWPRLEVSWRAAGGL